MIVVYVDTSVLVALLVPEPHSLAVKRWYVQSRAELVSSVWCVTEFASALGIKQRTGQLDAVQAATAWQRFTRFTAHDLTLLPVVPSSFQQAAVWVLDAATGLRAGDALHLTSAGQAGAKIMATLDAVLGRNAQRLKMKLVDFE